MSIARMNYKGCTAVIKSQNDDSEVRTTILEHDSNFMTIEVQGRLKGMEAGDQVTILVMLPNTAHEFNGVLRKVGGVSSSMTMFNGKVREGRGAIRYLTNSPAEVGHLVFAQQLVPLLHPLQVLLINVSTSGALIRAQSNSFVQDAVAELRININGKETVLQGTVVRVCDIDETTSEYGFQFI